MRSQKEVRRSPRILPRTWSRLPLHPPIHHHRPLNHPHLSHYPLLLPHRQKSHYLHLRHPHPPQSSLHRYLHHLRHHTHLPPPRHQEARTPLYGVYAPPTFPTRAHAPVQLSVASLSTTSPFQARAPAPKSQARTPSAASRTPAATPALWLASLFARNAPSA